MWKITQIVFNRILLIILGSKVSNMLEINYRLVIRDYREQLCKCCGQLKIKIQNLHQDLLGRNIIFEESRK